MTDIHVLTYETTPLSNKVEIFGRFKDGSAASSHVQLPQTWVWDTIQSSLPKGDLPQHRKRYIQANELYGTKRTAYLEVTFADKEPTGPVRRRSEWLDNKLDRYHAHCARKGWGPCSWITSMWPLEMQQRTPAPATVMAIDIEAEPGPNMEFPVATANRVLQIAAVIDRDMFGATRAPEMHLFALGHIGGQLPKIDEFDPEGCTLHCYEHETHMMSGFEQFVRCQDPDVITGWNTEGFDLPYLDERMQALVSRGIGLGRRGHEARVFKKANGAKSTTMHGRIHADLLAIWRSDHVERSYKLDNVAAAHLGASKAPVSYDQIRTLQQTPEGRARMGTYCLKDAYLVWKLAAKRKKWINALEMSHVTHVPLKHLFSRGQQWKVFSLLTHYAYNASPRIVVPSEPPASEAGYEGAVVINPIPGFYTECVSTLDFASLYPSIMIAFNMCYTGRRQQVTPWELARSIGVQEDHAKLIMQFAGYSRALIEAVPADARVYHRCGKASFQRKPQGLLPKILQTLLANRKKAKKAMKAANTPLEYSIQDGKQLALKLCANSLYGFTGTSQEVGMLPCPEIASAVTFMGRKLTLNTKRICERDFDVTGCYGDTDSVFLHQHGQKDIAEAAKHAEVMADHVNKMLPPPVLLEYEKTYKPLLLLKKKRYCGNKFDEGRSPPTLDAKGLEMVRRDNFPMVPTVMRAAVDALMAEDVGKAMEVTGRALETIRAQEHLPMPDFTISKELTKPVDKYANAPPHVVVAKTVPHQLHDRIPYIISTGRGTIGDRAVHPDLWNSGRHSIDREWYAQQLVKCMERLLEPCCTKQQLADTMASGSDRQITGTSQTGILRALGAPKGLVWRKRKATVVQKADIKKSRQTSLRNFF